MKEYERYVVWLEYFNSELKRNQGRRVPLSAATKAPKLEELTEACRRLNLQPSAQPAAFPRGGRADSGYVSVKKVKPKQTLLAKIAKELTVVRGRAAAKQASQQQPQRKQ
jgi:signal recognition particle subunit SEC65